MKGWFDRHNKSREFMPGDKVLVLAGLLLWPLLSSGEGQGQRLSCSYPDFRCKNHLCHINVLKSYGEWELAQLDAETGDPFATVRC